MDGKPRTDLDRDVAGDEETIQMMKRIARALVVGLMLGVALYAFGVETWKILLTFAMVVALCAVGFGRHRLEQVAMIALGIAALVWLQIPVVNRLLSGADKLLGWVGA